MNKPKTSRLFALVSYISDPAQIISVICAKSKQIRAFAYILHDRDKADPHHHIVIRTYHSKTVAQVCAWFKDDVNGQNTLGAFVESPEGIIAYLTHSNDPEQTQYDESEITDGGIADILAVANARDDTLDIIEDILAGVSFRTLVFRYGRNIVVNYKHYYDFASKICTQDNDEVMSADEETYLDYVTPPENGVPASPNYTKL